jgi:ATP-binding cassette, subfamily B, bacterial
MEPTTPGFGTIVREGFRMLAGFIRAHPGSFALAVFGSANFAAAVVASALVVGSFTDELIVPVLEEGSERGDRLRAAVLALVAIAAWKAVGILLRRTGATWLQARTQADIRTRLVEHLMNLELVWFRKQSTGDLLAVSDSDSAQSTYALSPLPYGTGVILLLLGSVVVVFVLDPMLGLIASVGMLLKLMLDIRGMVKTFGGFEAIQVARGRTSGVAHESVDGALTVKALGREDHEVARFTAASEALRDRLVSVARTFTFYDAVQDASLALTTVAVLVAGAARVEAGAVTAGDLVTVTYLLSLVAFPLRVVGFVLWEIGGSLAAWRRVEDVMGIDEHVGYGEITASPSPSGAVVESAGVSFGYEPDDLVLADVHLEIPAGRTTAIVGPTGSGKSTLVTLMARLWDPDSGEIRIDGRDLRSFARSALPGEVAFVGQDVFLFDDTIRNNIGFGLDVDDAVVERAARLASAHEFIIRLPNGYDTVIGERGTSLSGGQRQRIALARALARRPRLLILDDATSAVDPSVETDILTGLRRADLPSTVVVVAYRRSSIALADEVVFLEEGRIVARGPHDRLLFEAPGYARLLQAYERDAEARAGREPS